MITLYLLVIVATSGGITSIGPYSQTACEVAKAAVMTSVVSARAVCVPLPAVQGGVR